MVLQKLNICFVLVFFSVLCVGQYNNPFEIRHRLDSLYELPGGNLNIPEIDTILTTGEASGDTTELLVTPPGVIRGIVNPFDVNHVPIRKSELQKTSVIKQKKNVPVERGSSGGSTLIVFGVAILSLLLIAIVANVKRSLFTKVFKSFTNDNMLKLTQREENNGMNAGFLILYIVYVLNAASLLYLLMLQSHSINHGVWVLILLVMVGIYLIRHISMFILGLIFPVAKESSQYSFLIAIVNILLGIVLIPINLVIAYAPEPLVVAMTYSVIGILGFAFIIRSIKGLLIGLVNYSAYLFHFFLYLCTFEIVPVLLIYRVFTNISA